MRIRGKIVSFGPILSEEGPKRDLQMRSLGFKSLRESWALYGQICLRLGIDFAGGVEKIPKALGASSLEGSRYDQVKSDWLDFRRVVFQYSHPLTPRRLTDLESDAHKCLRLSIDAYNYLEFSEFNEYVHQYVHDIAALVSGVFGCKLGFRDGIYLNTCPLSLMHQRWGFSIGFTSLHICSICLREVDDDDCIHIRGEVYSTKVRVGDDGKCELCVDPCPHLEGEVVDATAHHILTEVQGHEVSMVRKPRDPLARVVEIEIDSEILVSKIGFLPRGETLYCQQCLGSCPGFTFP